jgi:16S rRNA (adenine1518-N6/adenine1519-N6)-dimethyltransferase
MPIYKPSELRVFLDELRLFPKKRFSQNFLIDGNIIRKILTVSEVNEKDLVLEIGPGPGALTQALLEAGAHVIAVEKDDILANALLRLQTAEQQLTIHCQDILDFSIETECLPYLKTGKKAKVIANLPYHLTTPILAKISPLRDLFSSFTIMVQEEVARRFTAQPDTSEYSSFTIFLQFYAQPHYAFPVSENCFYPVPNVKSAVITLLLREPPLPKEDVDLFFQLTRTAFGQRRKMLRASLKPIFSSVKIEKALEMIGESPLSRPEILSLEKFVSLYQILYEKNKKNKL